MAQARSTYRAVQAVRPGKLELTERPVVDPPTGHVRIRVEACGVCHSDGGTVEGGFPIQWPRVPGHEAVGRIEALGDGVEGWAVGQHVGVGFLNGSCGHCIFCRDGDLPSCANQGFTGVQQDGGYAEMLIAKSSALVSVPDALSSVAAAPLLCAGLTTFNALRASPARAGDLVAVIGIGGLGHLAVQYARRMGFEVAAIGHSAEKAELAKKLGAHHYIDSTASKPAEALQALGGATVVLDTASAGKGAAEIIRGLRPQGVVMAVGVTDDPIEVSTFDLMFRRVRAGDGFAGNAGRRVHGSLTGNPATGDATMRFSVLTGVAAMIETVPLERAAEAYARMMAGKATFRMVLTM